MQKYSIFLCKSNIFELFGWFGPRLGSAYRALSSDIHGSTILLKVNSNSPWRVEFYVWCLGIFASHSEAVQGCKMFFYKIKFKVLIFKSRIILTVRNKYIYALLANKFIKNSDQRCTLKAFKKNKMLVRNILYGNVRNTYVQ